jgi:hypothetical protein
MRTPSTLVKDELVAARARSQPHLARMGVEIDEDALPVRKLKAQRIVALNLADVDATFFY